MKNEMQKFFEFNGEKIFFYRYEGQLWIAVKPICIILNVDYARQHKRLQEDPIMSKLKDQKKVIAADNRRRKMVCLPEFIIYNWIYSLRSNSQELLKCKFNICKALYENLHGKPANLELMFNPSFSQTINNQ